MGKGKWKRARAKQMKLDMEDEDVKESRVLSMESRVVIKEDVYKKIMHWVNKSNFEVSGLGTVEFIDGVAYITEAFLLKQKNGSTTTEMDPNSVTKLMYEQRNSPGHLNFWWHSHVNMPTFWSGTDKQTITELGGPGWFISTVFNKKRGMRTSYYSGGPFLSFVDSIKTEIEPSFDERTLAWDAEYDLKVENETYQSPYAAGEYKGNYKSTQPYLAGEEMDLTEWNLRHKRVGLTKDVRENLNSDDMDPILLAEIMDMRQQGIPEDMIENYCKEWDEDMHEAGVYT